MMKSGKGAIRISSLNDITPFLTFLIIVIFFGVATQGKIFTPNNLRILTDQSITTLVAGLGMIFVIAMGGTDITAGGIVVTAGYASYILGCQYGVGVAFAVAIAIGLASGVIIGVVNARFKVSSFMATLALGIIALRGVASVIIDSYKAEIIITPEYAALNTFPIKLPIVGVLLLIVLYVFHYTSFGYHCRAIGENEVAVKYAGINVTRTKIIAFIISGVMAGFSAIFTVSRASGVQSSLGTGFEMNIMIAIFVAGVPVSGGMGAKIYKLFLGAFSLLVLQNGMMMLGLSGAVIQGVRGVILLAIVYLSVMLNEKGAGGLTLWQPKRDKHAA